MNEDDENSLIKRPQAHRAADIGRAAAKGVVGAIPLVGSLAAEAAGFALPDPTARDRDRWEGEVTDGVNSLHGRVENLAQFTGIRTITLSGAAAAAARYLAEHCPNGLAHTYVELGAILASDSYLDREEVIDGLGELESYNWVEPLDTIGMHHSYRLTEDAYEVLDPPIMGWDPQEDARAMATVAIAVEQGGAVNVPDLDAALTWPKRRFNPALRVLLRTIDPEAVSRELQPTYLTSYFYVSNGDRARLRRFADGR